jgi:hypothetical protein
MSCCGQKRAAWTGSLPRRAHVSTSPFTTTAAQVAASRVLRLVYEYVGPSAVSITSPNTGRRYRFERKGARLEIDPRDRPLLDALPQLRRVI